MNRAPARPKRSTTPTSATFPSASDQLPPSPQPQSNGGPGGAKPLYLCSPFVDAALVTGNFKTIVMLPKYVDVMEWVACNGLFLLLRHNDARSQAPTSFRLLPEPQLVLRSDI